MVHYNSEVDNLLYKIIFEEGLDQIEAALQQPIEPTPIIMREEFSDPMFARKFNALNEARILKNGYGMTGQKRVKKIIKEVEETFEVVA